jgi:hypothetical protein
MTVVSSGRASPMRSTNSTMWLPQRPRGGNAGARAQDRHRDRSDWAYNPGQKCCLSALPYPGQYLGYPGTTGANVHRLHRRCNRSAVSSPAGADPARGAASTGASARVLRAGKLAADPDLLASVRRRMDQNRVNSPFDPDRFRRGLEAAYTEMWHLHERGETPRSVAGPIPSCFANTQSLESVGLRQRETGTNE